MPRCPANCMNELYCLAQTLECLAWTSTAGMQGACPQLHSATCSHHALGDVIHEDDMRLGRRACG